MVLLGNMKLGLGIEVQPDLVATIFPVLESSLIFSCRWICCWLLKQEGLLGPWLWNVCLTHTKISSVVLSCMFDFARKDDLSCFYKTRGAPNFLNAKCAKEKKAKIYWISLAVWFLMHGLLQGNCGYSRERECPGYCDRWSGLPYSGGVTRGCQVKQKLCLSLETFLLQLQLLEIPIVFSLCEAIRSLQPIHKLHWTGIENV